MTDHITQLDRQNNIAKWRHPKEMALLEDAEATGPGQEVDVAGRNIITIQLTGDLTGTVNIEGTIDGTNFAPLKQADGGSADLTAAGVYRFEGFFKSIRANVKERTGGSATVKGLAGRA